MPFTPAKKPIEIEKLTSRYLKTNGGTPTEKQARMILVEVAGGVLALWERYQSLEAYIVANLKPVDKTQAPKNGDSFKAAVEWFRDKILPDLVKAIIVVLIAYWVAEIRASGSLSPGP